MESQEKEKKKKKQKEIKDKDAEVNEKKDLIAVTNLVQSSTMTFASYDFTLIQSKVLVYIIEELQRFIKESITNTKNNVHRQSSLFTDKDFVDDTEPGVVKFRISLSELSNNCQQYRAVKNAALAMSAISVELPYIDKDGQPWTEIDHLCRIRIPRKKQVDQIEVVIRKKTAEYLLDVKSRGYTEYLKEVIECSSNQYTPRIYMILCAYVKRQDAVTIKMKELRKFLKLETKYKAYKDFKKNVLENAYKDLEKLFNAGISDFYYTYENCYNDRKRWRGEPDYILFNFHKNDKNNQEKENDIAMQNYVYELLRSNTFLMDEDSAREISRGVNGKTRQKILYKIMDLSEIFRKDSMIINKAAYAYTALKKFLDEIKE